jgi:hypothetical protein
LNFFSRGVLLFSEMANVRSKDRKGVSFWAHEKFVAKMDEARHKLREDRSRFITLAIADRLSAMGFVFDPEWLYAPDRSSRVFVIDPPVDSALMAAEKPTPYLAKKTPPSSGPALVLTKAIANHVADRLPPSRPVGRPSPAVAPPLAHKKKG